LGLRNSTTFTCGSCVATVSLADLRHRHGRDQPRAAIETAAKVFGRASSLPDVVEAGRIALVERLGPIPAP
jgi:hypothetical protein